VATATARTKNLVARFGSLRGDDFGLLVLPAVVADDDDEEDASSRPASSERSVSSVFVHRPGGGEFGKCRKTTLIFLVGVAAALLLLTYIYIYLLVPSHSVTGLFSVSLFFFSNSQKVYQLATLISAHSRCRRLAGTLYVLIGVVIVLR
jgi:hypothetical protein